MLGFHQRFVGKTEFPRSLTDIDVGLCFRLSPQATSALKAKFKRNALGPSVLLVFLRASGRPLENLSAISYILLKYLCVELAVNETAIASIKTLYKRPNTLVDHEKWVQQHAFF